MDRTAALALIQSLGYGSLMTAASRVLTDTPEGYGPALDRAFAAYAFAFDLDTVPTEIPASAEFGFQSVLRATTIEMLLPFYATMVDGSVDAPLTSAKFSQVYKSLKDQAEMAWSDACSFGYVMRSNVGGFKVNLDFLEPGTGTEGEYA